MTHIGFLAKRPHGWMAMLLGVALLMPGTAIADSGSTLAVAESGNAEGGVCSGAANSRVIGALERMRMSQRAGGVSQAGCGADDQADAAQAQRFLDAFSGGRATRKRVGQRGMDSVAVPVSRTAFDGHWQRVRGAAPAGVMQAGLTKAGVATDMAMAPLLDRVNRWVNQNIGYQPDDRQYGQRDYWATAAETMAKKSGDCEDFAILKMHMLRAAGVQPSKMRLMLLRDLAANADHAFLLVSTDAGDVILDNLSDRVYAAADVSDVRPILSFSEDRRWVYALRDVAAN